MDLGNKVKTSPVKSCAICKSSAPQAALIPFGIIRHSVTEEMLKSYPQLTATQYICANDLNVFRNKYVENLLQDEKGELTRLEKDVVEALSAHELLSEHPLIADDGKLTFGERLSDKLASFGGSWRFLIFFAVMLFVWIVLNSVVLLLHPFDPFPFILLNLILSCLASIQAPVIMMSQNRQEAKDRLRSEYDYRINLKAELEIRHLHEKMDHLLKHQWERLVEIQQLQLEIMNELMGKKNDR